MNTTSFHERPNFAITLWRRLTISSFTLLVATALLSKAVVGSDLFSWLIEHFNRKQGLMLSPSQLALQLINLREITIGIHVAMGYCFTLLLATGILFELIKRTRHQQKHSAFNKGSIIAFSGILLTMAGSGFWMVFNEDMEIFAPAQFNSMKSMHQLAYHSLLVTSMLYASLRLLPKEKKLLQQAFAKFILRPLSLEKAPY
jgi:cytochrome bd-type quinol oxidase subunit 2